MGTDELLDSGKQAYEDKVAKFFESAAVAVEGAPPKPQTIALQDAGLANVLHMRPSTTPCCRP